jgi:hypothetical protein
MRVVSLLLIVWAFGCCGVAEAGFAPENEVVASGLEGVDATGIATDSQGDTLLAWDQLNPAEMKSELRARWLSPGGELGSVIDLSPSGFGFGPMVAIGPAGGAFVAWRVIGEIGVGSAVLGRWVNRDGSLGPLLTLETPEAGKFDAVEVVDAVDPTGVATVAWRNEKSGFAALELRRVTPDSSMGPTVPKAGTGVGDLKIAALPDGSTLAVWRNVGIEANTVAPDLTVGTQQKISSSSLTASPELAVNLHGDSLVTWRESLSEPFSVHGVRLDPSGAPVGEELTVDPGGPGGVSTINAVSGDSSGHFLVT